MLIFVNGRGLESGHALRYAKRLVWRDPVWRDPVWRDPVWRDPPSVEPLGLLHMNILRRISCC
ncbi:hypothetical protein WJR50_23560 [Catalinimonas sp. 4WD22]|uniref:hypothetical protein n=1 Tax=Catalinimonas locisalis TaxID=3133978 RepID=UPI0031013EA1